MPFRVGPCAFAALAALAACGCSDHGVGPCEPVSGTVTLDGQPLRGVVGTVDFVPDRSKGNNSPFTAHGTVDGEGRYVLSTRGKIGAPPGWYKVVVSATPPGADRDSAKLVVHSRFAAEATTPLRCEVVANAPAGAYDLKLTRK
ncbi:MAG TPA: hypothetical protein VFA26_23305 [Gemmataceae bacterium]|nr:hypothetical protein [Gemmataceae bacterium]